MTSTKSLSPETPPPPPPPMTTDAFPLALGASLAASQPKGKPGKVVTSAGIATKKSGTNSTDLGGWGAALKQIGVAGGSAMSGKVKKKSGISVVRTVTVPTKLKSPTAKVVVTAGGSTSTAGAAGASADVLSDDDEDDQTVTPTSTTSVESGGGAGLRIDSQKVMSGAPPGLLLPAGRLQRQDMLELEYPVLQSQSSSSNRSSSHSDKTSTSSSPFVSASATPTDVHTPHSDSSTPIGRSPTARSPSANPSQAPPPPPGFPSKTASTSTSTSNATAAATATTATTATVMSAMSSGGQGAAVKAAALPRQSGWAKQKIGGASESAAIREVGAAARGAAAANFSSYGDGLVGSASPSSVFATEDDFPTLGVISTTRTLNINSQKSNSGKR